MPLVTDPKILEALEGDAAASGAQTSFTAPAGLRPIEDAELLKRLEAKESGPASVSQVEPPTQGRHGIARNFAAGANEGIAGFISAPVDAANTLLSGVDHAWNWMTGSTGRHLSSDQPVGGSKSLKAGMGAAGIDTDSVEASTPAERIARGAGAGVSGMVLPAGAARAALNAGVGAGSAVVGPVLEGIAGPLPTSSTLPAALGNMATGAGVGAGAGAAGQFVEEVAPHPTVTVGGEAVDLSPLTRFGGELVGGGVVGGVASVAGGATRAAVRAVERGVEPFTPRGREAAVARTLRENAANPDGLAGRLEEGGTEIVPGSAPTAAQAAGDAGLLAMERGVSRRDPAPFLERQAEQNAARTVAVGGLAPEGNAAAVGDAFKRTLAQIQTDADGQIARALEQRAATLDELGGGRAPEQYGSDLRNILESTKAAEKTAVGRLYAAVDPDGTLALDIAPLKQVAQRIVADLPKAAALSPVEGRLYDVVRSMPDVERFGELGGLRSELTAAIRAERFTGGETPALRRMSQMLSAVDDTIARTMAPQEGAAAARGVGTPEVRGVAPETGGMVSAGQSSPVEAFSSWLQQDVKAWTDARRAEAATGRSIGAGYGESRPDAVGAGGVSAASRAAGQAERGPAASPRDQSLPRETLTPNVDPAAIGRYRDANAVYRDFAERFKGGPVAATLQADRQGAYRVADSDVAARFFHGGKSSLEDVNAFARAVGDNQTAAATLIDYAASDLRRYAVKPDGSIDGRRWRTWMDRNFQALKGLDQLTGSAKLRGRFQRLADAQQMVDDLGEARTRTVAEFQNSAARFFLDADPVRAVEGALRSKDPAAAFADLSRRVSQDPEATAGLRRAVIEHMQARLRGNAEAGDTGLSLWKSDAFQTYIRQNAPALRQVFTADQMKAMEAVAADLQRANRSVAGSKLPGGSDTAQNVAALASLPGGSILWRLIGGAGMAGSGAYGGAIAGGPLGAVAGAAIGGLAQLGREIGMRRINDLLTEAMLNPSLAAQLLRKAGRPEEPQLLAQLSRRLLSLGILTAGDAAISDPIPTTRPAVRQRAEAPMSAGHGAGVMGMPAPLSQPRALQSTPFQDPLVPCP